MKRLHSEGVEEVLDVEEVKGGVEVGEVEEVDRVDMQLERATVVQ